MPWLTCAPILEGFDRPISILSISRAFLLTAADFRGLRKLALASGRRFSAGVVLYDGETGAGFGDHLYAVPIRALWET